MMYNGFMKDSFKHNTAADGAGLARYLTALAEALENGSLPLTRPGRSFNLHPRGLIDVGLKVRCKNGRGRLTLNLSWAEEEPELFPDSPAAPRSGEEAAAGREEAGRPGAAENP